jgi:hypothetical protein
MRIFVGRLYAAGAADRMKSRREIILLPAFTEKEAVSGSL